MRIHPRLNSHSASLGLWTHCGLLPSKVALEGMKEGDGEAAQGPECLRTGVCVDLRGLRHVPGCRTGRHAPPRRMTVLKSSSTPDLGLTIRLGLPPSILWDTR